MSPTAITAQLEKILSSPQFSQAGRLSRFLRFVVEAAQGGHAASLKEYLIGVEVFDRGKDFDPRIDPIVRVQAAKLRSKLMEYYASAGAKDPIVIGMPKGSYAPELRQQQPPPEAAAPKPAAERSRIAVLPFLNMSSDPENEYFSDGLTEELINRLARVPSLQVVARTSAFRFKGRNEDLREVGAKLDVGTVMEGSVRKAGEQVRITAQLIDVQSGYHLFSQTYHREYKNIFELQDELAQAVVDEIAPLSAAPASRIVVKTRPVNLDAYNKYLRGMHAISNRFVEREQWIEPFREAIHIDPGCAPAWAGLAHGYFMLSWFYQMPASEALPLSKDAALKTLELDPNLGIGHNSLGLVQSAYEWNWAAAEASFQKAMELQPGLALAYLPFAVCCLLPQLRLEEACRTGETGLSLDPYNPLSQAQMIYVYAIAGRYDDALRLQAFARELHPSYAPLFYSGGLTHEVQGHRDQAISWYRHAMELAGTLPATASALAYVLALSGETDEARRMVQRLLAIPDQPSFDIATVYLGLREDGEALRWLEIAAEQRNLRMVMVPCDPRFRRLGNNARFQAVLKRMGLQTAITAA